MTDTLFEIITDRLSNNLLALISCITPIIVLITAININKVFLKEPTETNKQTKTIFMRLKSVNMLSLKICLYVLVFPFSNALIKLSSILL